MSFFSEFRSKFPSKYSGQYLEAIIKSLANNDLRLNPDRMPAIALPILKKLKIKSTGLSNVQFTSESPYKGLAQDRRADLHIEFQNADNHYVEIFIEIKVDDDIIQAKQADSTQVKHVDQLEDYLRWLNISPFKKRYFLLLTAHPIDPQHLKKIKDNPNAQHLYLSDFAQELEKQKSTNDTLIDLFLAYLKDEGYIMFKPDDDDLDAFKSFMALNFLVHASGHGRVVSMNKIANGPIVFANFVKNWQLLSARVHAFLKTGITPTIRYLPEQILKTKSSLDASETLTQHRIDMQNRREQGRLWLISEVVVKKGGPNTRLSWGLIYSISNANTKSADNDSSIICKHFVALQTGRNNVHKEIVGEDMVLSKYADRSAEDLVNDLLKLIKQVDQYAVSEKICESFLNTTHD